MEIGQKITITDPNEEKIEVTIMEIDGDTIYFEAPGVYGTVNKSYWEK